MSLSINKTKAFTSQYDKGDQKTEFVLTLLPALAKQKLFHMGVNSVVPLEKEKNKEAVKREQQIRNFVLEHMVEIVASGVSEIRHLYDEKEKAFIDLKKEEITEEVISKFENDILMELFMEILAFNQLGEDIKKN